MLWEKNGQLKMLMTDAAFSGSVPQESVFESVQGQTMVDAMRVVAVAQTYD